MSDISYSSKLKAIRPYVSFNYDLRKPLTPAQKRKITIYYEKILEYTNRPYYTYRPRSKDKLKKVSKFAGQEGAPDLKVAFIPSAKKPEKITVQGDKISIFTDGVKSVFIPFDQIKLVGDDEEIIKYVTGLGNKKDRYIIQTGLHQDFGARKIEGAAGRVAFLINTYPSSDKWLSGMMEISFRNQESLIDYQKARDDARRVKKAKSARRKRWAKGAKL